MRLQQRLNSLLRPLHSTLLQPELRSSSPPPPDFGDFYRGARWRSRENASAPAAVFDAAVSILVNKTAEYAATSSTRFATGLQHNPMIFALVHARSGALRLQEEGGAWPTFLLMGPRRYVAAHRVVQLVYSDAATSTISPLSSPAHRWFNCRLLPPVAVAVKVRMHALYSSIAPSYS